MRPMKVLNLHSGQQRSVDTGNVTQQTGDQCRTLSGGHGVDTGPSSRCDSDSEPFYYDRPSAISQECSYILYKCCCLSWVTTDSDGGDVVNEDQHWSRMVDVLTVYLED